MNLYLYDRGRDMYYYYDQGVRVTSLNVVSFSVHKKKVTVTVHFRHSSLRCVQCHDIVIILYYVQATHAGTTRCACRSAPHPPLPFEPQPPAQFLPQNTRSGWNNFHEHFTASSISRGSCSKLKVSLPGLYETRLAA